MTAWNVSPVRISSPPMTSGISIRSLCISRRRRWSSSRSGDPGPKSCTGSFFASGSVKIPGALTGRL
jgi:hypothetical protein